MFSFHKPRIYRSATGCCICRAKSSSSRFTDSRRYEADFYACFKLIECRTGDICNACVLLVKRWKKLPKGSQRNWHHVVDARAGHGSKPISKINRVKKGGAINNISKIKTPPIELTDKMRNVMKKHISPPKAYINQLGRNREQSPSGCSDDVQMDCISSESGSYHSSLAASPTPSEVGDEDMSYTARNKRAKGSAEAARPLSHQQLVNNGGPAKIARGRDTLYKSRKNSDASHSSFLDLSFWKREKTCCGIIFKGPCGEVLLDRRFLSPCFLRSVKDDEECEHSDEKVNPQRPHESVSTAIGTRASESCGVAPRIDMGIPVDCISVDSGYDDSSNSAPDPFKMLPNNGIRCVGGKVKVDLLKPPSLISSKLRNYSPPQLTVSCISGEPLDVSANVLAGPPALTRVTPLHRTAN